MKHADTLHMIKYQLPTRWIGFSQAEITKELIEAHAAIISLKTVPYQRRWLDRLQQLQLKREIAGTSRIEGAEFSERELDQALRESPEQLLSRSQKQAHAAVQTYRWIAEIPSDHPVNEALIMEIHRRIVKDADDDHCEPGVLRRRDDNVTFGTPRHRGVEGGDATADAFSRLAAAINGEYRGVDPIVQAFAVHYHFAAMHPFADGNGRTARAVEALLLGRVGLRSTAFIGLSNYYHDEKVAYLKALADVRQLDHDLTPFLKFALTGLARQCHSLLLEIQHEIEKELFRNLMVDMFGRLQTKRKRVIANRQMEVLRILLEVERIEWSDLIKQTRGVYSTLKEPTRSLVRDVTYLQALRALKVERIRDGKIELSICLDWPREITETSFFEKVKQYPKSKMLPFLQ